MYKSQGRKDFETNSPTQIRSLSLMGCASKDFGDSLPTGEVREWAVTDSGRLVQIYLSDDANSPSFVALQSTRPEPETCLYQSFESLYSPIARQEIFRSIDEQQP